MFFFFATGLEKPVVFCLRVVVMMTNDASSESSYSLGSEDCSKTGDSECYFVESATTR